MEVQDFVPFNRKTGNMYGIERQPTDIEWRNVYTFTAKLTFVRYIHSKECSIWKDEHQHLYCMFISEVFKAAQTGCIEKGSIKGVWGFVRSGVSYSVTYKGDV